MNYDERMHQEIVTAITNAESMLAAYAGFGKQYRTGETANTLYWDILDFVNFRMETADSCLRLVQIGRPADALGLCRSLLENYLLLKLLCRGTKYFDMVPFDNLNDRQWKAKVEEVQAEHAEKLASGETDIIEIRKYPRRGRRLMYIREGLKDASRTDGFMIPIHYFHFRDFQPETMRLKDEDYFVYYEPPEDLQAARKEHMAQASFRYRYYLSYDALLACLELCGLSDSAVQARIDAHYTFLGKFLHPTHDAARDLHRNSNVHTGKTGVGLEQPYDPAAILLAAVYVCHILADILDEVALLFETAPSDYISEPGTSDIRAAASQARQRFPYFWFVYNEPTLYDKFDYAVHHVTDEELEVWGGYTGVPSERVKFNQHIYGQFSSALQGWSNRRIGVYTSPLAKISV